MGLEGRAHRPRGGLGEVTASHRPIGVLHRRLPRRQRRLRLLRRLLLLRRLRERRLPLLRLLLRLSLLRLLLRLPRRHRLLPGCGELLELVLLPRLPQ